MSNYLKISAASLKLELSGDQQTIMQAYNMTRELLISCFEAQFDQPSAPSSPSDATRPLHVLPMPTPEAVKKETVTDPQQAKHWRPTDLNNLSHINIVLSSEFYNKVCVLDRVEFDTSILSKVLRFEGIDRLYIRHEQYPLFEPHFTIGKVLWRELTPLGKKSVRNNKIEDPTKKP